MSSEFERRGSNSGPPSTSTSSGRVNAPFQPQLQTQTAALQPTWNETRDCLGFSFVNIEPEAKQARQAKYKMSCASQR